MESSSSPRMYESGVTSAPHAAAVTSPSNGSISGASSPSGSVGGGADRTAAATAASAKLGPSGPSALKVKNFNAPGAGTASAAGGPTASGGELAELTSNEISIDLQGLIDDSPFADDDNLFGDLIDAKKNELNHGYGLHHTGVSRTSPNGSLGSSGHNSPGAASTDSGAPAGGSSAFGYRPPGHIGSHHHGSGPSTLGYLPGSVHNGAGAGGYVPPPQAGHAGSVQVKQEPGHLGDDYRNSQSFPGNNNNSSSYSNGTVSSTTPSCGGAGSSSSSSSSSSSTSSSSYMNTPLPSLKSFATPPKYLTTPVSQLGGSKKRVDRNSDEYRRRRERNNVAVRKSREKAKARTKETEERVKILARDNEHLLKKTELLQEELSVLRSLFSNVGVLPEHIHRELSKHMENFQAQHNAMACM